MTRVGSQRHSKIYIYIYNFFCGPFYLIVIGNNTKSVWPTSAPPAFATTKHLENALQTCYRFASLRTVD